MSPKLTKKQQNEIEQLKLAQQRPIKNLVFSGGGAKGVVYPGAFRAMQESGLLARVSNIAGASAGAITAALISVGTPITKIREMSLHVNMESLMGSRVYERNQGVIPSITKDGNDLYSFIKEQMKQALITINRVDLNNRIRTFKQSASADILDQVYVAELLKKKLDDEDYDITFADLHVLHLLDPQRFKNLTVTAIKLPGGEAQQFDYQKTPQVSIALACRASASIPIILKPVAIRINGNTSNYIDGGIENNLPTNLISDPLHREDTLVFAFGEGHKTGAYYRQNRVEHAMHRGHWSEAVTLNFLHSIYAGALEMCCPL
ncbi:MAG: patatin-like phospholipase family protein [bacterium]|nr:patatin-like phospholipase family protein [bacterium]